MINVKSFTFCAVATLLCQCQTKETSNIADGADSFTTQALGAHIKALSADEFMGRKPFTRGETRTLEYLEEAFKNAGAEPGNGESYLQQVPMVEITTQPDSIMTVSGAKGKFTLKGFEEYVLWTQQPEGAILKDDELVFAGYGIVAPEYNWNDYAGLDVKGKIVLVFVNDPGFGTGDTTLFKGNTMTYYGRWTYKYEEAARQGAKGCLIVHDDVPASYVFAVVQNNWKAAKLYLDNRDKELYTCPVEGWVSLPTAKRLFEEAGMNYAEKLSDAHKPGFRGETMKLKISTSMKAKAIYNKSYNVIAKVAGTTRPDEYVVYTAHWDHLGIGKADNTGDTIYNGALDNASGTAGLVELAKAFASMKNKPQRTTVFLAVTAEEQGLWGSAWYASNPVYPAEKTVANINMDGLNWFGKTKDIVVVGSGQSDLEDYLKDEAEKAGRYLSAESSPQAGYYFRSDHFNFAKAGIPALYTDNGIDHIEKGKDYGKEQNREYVDKYYHRPSDEYDTSRWNLDGAVDDLRLLYQVGKRIASEEKWPQWKSNSEFRGKGVRP